MYTIIALFALGLVYLGYDAYKMGMLWQFIQGILFALAAVGLFILAKHGFIP